MLKYPMIVRTRMAPSPTGDLHIGTLRTLLYNYAFAKQKQGQFILRIEDTDQKRLVVDSDKRLMETVKSFGLSWDEGPDVGGPYAPYIQTQRLDIYKNYIQELLDKGYAYYCFCTPERLTEMRDIQKAKKQLPKYDRHCLALSPEEIKKNLDNKTPYVIRMKIPDHQVIAFNDLIRGEIKFDTATIDDQILVKSNGIPTYHFAAVVDDHLMKITHVLRGEEWITSTPKHILLFQFLDWEAPIYAHVTVFLDPSHPGKMSKRYGSVFAQQFLDDGYLPDAMLNFLMLLGWNPGTEKEIYTLDEFITDFKLEQMHKKAPIFDRAKLDYLNGLYIRKKSDTKLAEVLAPFLPAATPSQLAIIAPLIKERIAKLSDATTLMAFVFNDVAPKVEDLLNNNKIDKSVATDMLTKTIALLSDYSDIQNKLMSLIKENNWKTGDFFMVFRVAITGVRQTPPIVESLALLKQEVVINRLQAAQKLL